MIIKNKLFLILLFLLISNYSYAQISALPPAQPLTGTEQVPIDQSINNVLQTVRTSLSSIANLSNDCIVNDVAAGTGDAITIPALPLSCSPTQILLILSITAPNTTTAPTLTPAGGPTQIIKRFDNTALHVGDLTVGSQVQLINNGTNWFLLTLPSPSMILGIPPEQCGAVGDGNHDDTAAVTACDAAAVTANTSLLLDKTYRIVSNVTLNAPELFIQSASLKPNTGVTITINGNVSAPDSSVIFTGVGTATVPGSPRISIAWWGAVPAAVDSVPAIKKVIAAGINNKKVVCPPGNYTFNSVQQTRPFPTVNYTAIFITGQTNFELDCEGANILPGPDILASAQTANGGSPAAYGLFEIDGNSTDFKVHGFLFNGDYHSTGLQNTAFVMFGTQRFSMYNLDFSGNWGGLGDPFAGDWQVDGVYHDIKMANVGICYDFGYLQHIAFDKIFAHGSDGASGTGFKCLSVLPDTPNAGTNPTPVPITDTLGVSFTNSDVSNFANSAFGTSAVVLVGGRHYRFHGNYWHENPGSAAGGGSVFTIFYENGPPFDSTGNPVNDVIIDGDVFDNNGNTNPLPVFYVDSHQIVNSDTMGGFVISNNTFTRNSAGGFPLLDVNTTAGMAPTRAISGSGNYFDAATLFPPMSLPAIALGFLPGSRQTINSNSGVFAGGGSTAYTWINSVDPNENNVKSLSAPYNAFARNLNIFAVTPPGAGQQYAVIFRRNGSNTTLGCTIGGSSQACFDNIATHLVGIGPNDGIDLVMESTPGTPVTVFFWSIEIDVSE